MIRRIITVLAVVSALASIGEARAEATQLRVAKQFGIAYMQFFVMQDQQMIEKHAKAAGLGDVTVDWATFRSSDVMNDALISGSVEFVCLGIPGIITVWSKTRGTPIEVKAVSGLNVSPLMLLVRDPAIKSLRDFKDHHKIAMPAVKVSMQAIMFEMAVAKEFGIDKYNALDHLTVSMAHPDATAAMLGGPSEIVANFSSAPFQYRQMKNPNIRRLLTSTDLFDGGLSFNVIAATNKFRTENPKLYGAFRAALEGRDRLHQCRQEARGGNLSEGERRQDAGRRTDGDDRRPGDPIHDQSHGYRFVRELHGEGGHAQESAGGLARDVLPRGAERKMR